MGEGPKSFIAALQQLRRISGQRQLPFALNVASHVRKNLLDSDRDQRRPVACIGSHGTGHDVKLNDLAFLNISAMDVGADDVASSNSLTRSSNRLQFIASAHGRNWHETDQPGRSVIKHRTGTPSAVLLCPWCC